MYVIQNFGFGKIESLIGVSILCTGKKQRDEMGALPPDLCWKLPIRQQRRITLSNWQKHVKIIEGCRICDTSRSARPMTGRNGRR